MRVTDGHSSSSIVRLSFEGVAGHIQLEDGDHLLSVFESVFRHWPHRALTDDPQGQPVITVRAGDRGVHWIHAPWLDKPARYSNSVNLACGFGVNINRAFLAGPGEYLCLHAAAAEIGGRLVVFPNAYRAGKSTLTVCLAAAGARIFCDDILPVLRNTGNGMALGITPRLRLPWPANLGHGTAEFVAARRGAENSQYLYVNLRDGEQAPFGDTAPFGGIVLLNRREGERARLETVGLGEALKYVVLRNFARRVPMKESLERLHEILASTYCARITYSSGDEAAALLVDRFADWRELDRPGPRSDTVAAAEMTALPGSRSVDGRLRRSDGVTERIADGELFLVDSSREAIYHLNPVGTGLWRLLDGGCDVADAIGILHAAFPEASRADIERDVAKLVKDLQARGLLVDVDQTSETLRTGSSATR